MLKISVKSKKDLDPDSDDDSIYYSFGSKSGILALFRLFLARISPNGQRYPLSKLTYRPFPPGNIVKPIYFDSRVYEQDIVCNFKQIQRTEGMYRIASCGECSDCLDPDKERF